MPQQMNWRSPQWLILLSSASEIASQRRSFFIYVQCESTAFFLVASDFLKHVVLMLQKQEKKGDTDNAQKLLTTATWR